MNIEVTGLIAYGGNMEAGLRGRIKKLVAQECANFQANGPFSVKNFCWNREKSNGGVCVFFNQVNPRCGYFESSVLPLNPDLEEDYNNQLEESNGREIENRPVIQGEGAGRSVRGVTVITPQPQKSGVSVGQSLRKGVLLGRKIHGVGSNNPITGE